MALPLPSEHPCLFVPADQWAALRAAILSDPLRHRLLDHLRRRAHHLLSAEVLRYEKTGLRLLAISRQAVDRILLWSLLARLDGDGNYVRRAETEMLALAAFPDWNPAHFLDTAEMTLALGVGYDWLHHLLSPAVRSQIAQAILEKGLLASLNLPAKIPTGQPGDWWVAGTNNWTQVCHGGLTAGALAVAGEFPEVATQIIQRAIKHVPRAAECYEPDGVYPEGGQYWGYGTTYQVILLSVLRSALGSDFGLSNCPGLFKSLAFLTETNGPTGLAFNYSDGASQLPVEAAFFWLARHGDNPGLARWQRAKLEQHLQAAEDQGKEYSCDRFDVPLLLWMYPCDGLEPSLPLSWKGQSGCPIVVHRTAWDDQAIFVGLKGGKANNSHGHMDIGTFVLDADGVRWADDLGICDYHHYEAAGVDIWNLRSPTGRWGVLSVGPKTHNILSLDGAMQNPDGEGIFVGFSALRHRSLLDLTPVYSGQVTKARRGLAVAQGVLLQDELEGLALGTEVTWSLLTQADAAVEAEGFTLRREGKSLRILFEVPGETSFAVTEVDQLREAYDMKYPGFRVVQLRTKASILGPFCLKTHFLPGSLQSRGLSGLPVGPCGTWFDP